MSKKVWNFRQYFNTRLLVRGQYKLIFSLLARMDKSKLKKSNTCFNEWWSIYDLGKFIFIWASQISVYSPGRASRGKFLCYTQIWCHDLLITFSSEWPLYCGELGLLLWFDIFTVRRKVMFSQASVILSPGGGGVHSLGRHPPLGRPL